MDDVMSDVSNELTDSFSAQYVRCGDWNDFGDWGCAGLRGAVTVDNAGICAELFGVDDFIQERLTNGFATSCFEDYDCAVCGCVDCFRCGCAGLRIAGYCD